MSQASWHVYLGRMKSPWVEDSSWRNSNRLATLAAITKHHSHAYSHIRISSPMTRLKSEVKEVTWIVPSGGSGKDPSGLCSFWYLQALTCTYVAMFSHIILACPLEDCPHRGY